MNPLTQLNESWAALQSVIEAQSITLHKQIEFWAENFGKVITPIADIPLLKPLVNIPGLSWIAAALGQVNLAAIAQDIETLKDNQPEASQEQLAQKVIQEITLQAGGIGLATNLLPPIAVTLFAVDMAAIATLQVELIYKIAAIYDYDIQEQNRRGEVLALYVCSAGSSTLIKSGLSFPEMLPIIGAIVGASSDAGILWVIGQIAQQYYKTKREHQDTIVIDVQ